MLALALPLLVAAAGCAETADKRVNAVYALKASPTEENVARLRDLAHDQDRDVRATALHALVSLRVPDAAPFALAGLEDEDGFVRATAAKLVGDLGSTSGNAPLVELLLHDREPIVRQRAAEALERIGGDEAVEGLARAMVDPVETVRLAAVRAIADLAPEREAATLARLVVEDPIWEIRVQAAKGLGDSGDPAAAAALERALGDPNEFVRAAAANALGARGGEPPPPGPG